MAFINWKQRGEAIAQRVIAAGETGKRGVKLTLDRDTLKRIEELEKFGCYEKHIYKSIGIPESTW